MNAVCSGFVYAFAVAHGLLAIGSKRILVIGTDTLSRIVDWSDRSTAILFADGSGACIVDSVPDSGQLLGWNLDADGSLEHLLYAEIGGYIHMDGKEVFRRAVRIMVDSAQKSLAKAGLSVDDVKLCVPHQANLRIIDAACRSLGIPSNVPPSCCLKQETRRQRRFRWHCLMQPIVDAYKMATSCCS